jgi:hypothetical protein
MRLLVVVAIIAGFCLIPVNTVSQETYTQTRTQEIVASFNKEKYAVKEKYGVRREKYKKVVSEPVSKPTINEFAGVYEVSGPGFFIKLQIGSDGKVTANGSEPAKDDPQHPRGFRLDGAKITGAMLTATKVFDDGAREKFEGVFINMTVYESPTDKGVTAFGLGVVRHLESSGVMEDKLFYQFKK